MLLGSIADLDARERATAQELSRLDPQLGGLYRLGHEFAGRVAEPAVVYLLAHVGRELGRGVVRELAGEDLQASEVSDDGVPENEQNRVTIAAMLQLPPSHGSVAEWFRVNRTFTGAAHYRSPGASAEEVCDAFRRLSALLFGRVAPYFATHTELDRFLAVESPTATDVAAVRALLVRPQQRRYFFSHLQHPLWLVPLEEAGHFSAPPDRIVEADGRWRVQGWPEGEYLARVASKQPERVTEILLKIPPSLQNPTVWAIVIDAAKAMPAAQAVRLVPLLGQAFRTTPLIHFARGTIDLVRGLAEQGEVAAFRLAECLLWLSSSPNGVDAGQTGAPRRQRGLHDTEWMLERLDIYELSQFCSKSLPALEVLDPLRAIELLANRLDRAISLAQLAEGGEMPAPLDHLWWCPYVDRYSQRDDVRAMFAVALTGLAKRTLERDAGHAEAICSALHRYAAHGLFNRIRYALLASAGPLLQQPLDAAVSSGELLDPPCGARESTALLRAQFENASTDARRLFRYALERGPSGDEMKGLIEIQRAYQRSTTEDAASLDGPFSEAEVTEAVAVWQRKRLGWFHDRIPPELQALAERLGVTPHVPSAEEQALSEVGFSIGEDRSATRPQSPKTTDDLSAMAVDDIVTLLSTWRAEGDSFEGPSYRGLEDALTELATAHPGKATDILAKVLQASVAAGYLTALLTGLRKVAKQNNPVPWDRVLAIVLRAVQASEVAEARSASDEEERGIRAGRNDVSRWPLVVRAAAEVVQEGCANDAIPESLARDVWTYAEAAVRSPVTWADTWGGAEEPSLERAMMAAIDTATGDVVRMLLGVALWDYRQRSAARALGAELSVVRQVAARLELLLDHVLSQQGPAAQGAHAMLGHFIPQLHLLAPEWISSNEDRLFEHGADDPARHPIWGAYITRVRFYDSTFRRLRMWYLEAAEVASRCEGAPGNDHRERRESLLTEGLAVHVMVGVMRGLCGVGDEDALVEKTFMGVPVKDRSHAYWAVFRTFSGAEEPIPSEVLQRLVAFWEWRLSELERAQDTSARAEEADGLTWFLITPHLPAADAIRLGLRTLRLNKGERHTKHSAWERLGKLAECDAAETFDLVELLVEQELAASYSYLPHEEVARPLRVALQCDDLSVRRRAERLVHRLGEGGHLDFGSLLAVAKPMR